MQKPYLFTGEDSYSLKRNIQDWKKQFEIKHGGEGIFEFRGDDVELSSIKNCLMSGGMFSSKKFVIVHGVPKETSPTYRIPAHIQQATEERLQSHLENAPLDQETTLVLVCNKPDKRTKGWKFFEKHCTVKQFTPPKTKDCVTFIKHKLEGLVSIEQATMIVDLVGNNLWNLDHETEKLSLYAAHNSISSLTDEQIDQVVFHQGTINAFDLIDDLFTSRKKSIKTLEKIQHQQAEIFQINGMINRGLRIIIQMTDAYGHGIKSGSDIAKKIKAPPFAVAKQMKNIGWYVEHQQILYGFFGSLLKMEYDIKTGSLPAEGYRTVLKSLLYSLHDK